MGIRTCIGVRIATVKLVTRLLKDEHPYGRDTTISLPVSEHIDTDFQVQNPNLEQ
jgi:hypothetical protein